LVAVGDDIERGALGDASDVAEEGPGGGVEIDADAVNAALDYGFEGLLELSLIHVMLILTDADGFWVDLDELGERVLETARDGGGSTDGEIEVGELLAGDVRCGVDAGACLADGDGEEVVEVVITEEIADEGIGLTGGGSVAYRDGADVVFGDQSGEGVVCS